MSKNIVKKYLLLITPGIGSKMIIFTIFYRNLKLI